MGREHMAQLWPRRRNRKRMDCAKGRAMIGKFEMGQIVPTPGAPTNESAANSPEMTIQDIVSCGELGRRAARAIVATEQADLFRRGGPFPFYNCIAGSVTISAS